MQCIIKYTANELYDYLEQIKLLEMKSNTSLENHDGRTPAGRAYTRPPTPCSAGENTSLPSRGHPSLNKHDFDVPQARSLTLTTRTHITQTRIYADFVILKS